MESHAALIYTDVQMFIEKTVCFVKVILVAFKLVLTVQVLIFTKLCLILWPRYWIFSITDGQESRIPKS